MSLSSAVDPHYGARPLHRAIQRFVENPLSVRLLKSEFRPGDSMVIDVQDGDLRFGRHVSDPGYAVEIPQNQPQDNQRS